MTLHVELLAQLIAKGYSDAEDDCPTGGWTYLKLPPEKPWFACVHHGPPDGPGPSSSEPPRVEPSPPRGLPRETTPLNGFGQERVSRLMGEARRGR